MIKLIIDILSNPIKSKVKEYIFDNKITFDCSEDQFLGILNQRFFFVVFKFSIIDIERFFHHVGFVKTDDLIFTHTSGVSISITLSSQGYYISDLNINQRYIQFHYDDSCYIHCAYNKTTYKNLDYSVKFDDSTQIKSISYSNLSLVSSEYKHTNIMELLNNNISHIHEYVLDSFIIDNRIIEHATISDVVYFMPKNDTFNHVISLSEILLTCQLNIDKLINIKVTDLLDIRNIFNEDELKIIEMTYA